MTTFPEGSTATVTPAQKNSLVMLVLLVLLVFVYHFGTGVYYVNMLDPSPAFEFLYQAGFLCGVIWWLRSDAGTSAAKPVYCSGLLVGMGWFIIIPYHLFKTRGLKGFIPLLALIGSFVVAYILTLVVYLSLQSFNPP